MKKGSVLILLPLILMSLFPLVLAQTFIGAPIEFEWLQWLGPVFGLVSPFTLYEIIIVLIVCVMLFVAIGDILRDATAFSTPVSWIIAGCITIIGALTRGVLWIAHIFVTISAWAGMLSAFVAIFTAFIAFILVHLGINWGIDWVRKRQSNIRAYRGRTLVEEGITGAAEMGKTLEKVGRR